MSRKIWEDRRAVDIQSRNRMASTFAWALGCPARKENLLGPIADKIEFFERGRGNGRNLAPGPYGVRRLILRLTVSPIGWIAIKLKRKHPEGQCVKSSLDRMSDKIQNLVVNAVCLALHGGGVLLYAGVVEVATKDSAHFLLTKGRYLIYSKWVLGEDGSEKRLMGWVFIKRRNRSFGSLTKTMNFDRINPNLLVFPK